MFGGGRQKSSGSQQQGIEAIEPAKGLLGAVSPITGEAFLQTLQALRTGGIGPQLPLIGDSISQARAAASDARMGLQERLEKAGLSRPSTYGERQLADMDALKRQTVAAIPQQVTQDFLGRGRQEAFATLAAALQALSAAGTQKNKTSGFDFQAGL